MKNSKLYILMLMIGIVWAGCQTAGKRNQLRNERIAEEYRVESRILEYYKARKTEDTAKLYDMLIPEYRENVTLEEFIDSPREPSLGLMNFYIEGIDLKSDSEAIVWASEYAQPSGIPTMMLTTNIKTRWVKLDGEWYYDKELPADSINFEGCGNIHQPKSTP